MNIVKDIFLIKEIDMVPIDPSRPSVKIKNKIFPKVSRIYAISETRKVEFILDINTDIYKISIGDCLDFLIIDQIIKNSDSLDYENLFSDSLSLQLKGLLAEYEYVMYGSIFHSGVENGKTFFYASFGGLLLKIFGELEKTTENTLKNDLNILLLLKKRKIKDFSD